jgi:hypothetical protein
MPALSRRLDPDVRQECWLVYYGDVHVGTIGIRAGVPVDKDQWGWSCGFYPPSHEGRHIEGTAVTFEQARSEFEAAWKEYLPNCSEADFQEWRDHEAWTAEKYRRFDRHERMPPDWRASG